jgi:hypothetical protein
MPSKRFSYLFAFSIITGLITSSLTSKPLLAQTLLPGTDLGYTNLPKAFVDANGDGHVDYCRFVGDAPTIFIACMLGTPNGFDYATQNTAFLSVRGIDQGYADRPRGFRDVNGDGKADYCRFVGDSPNIYEACNLSASTGFDPNQSGHLSGKKDPNPVAASKIFPLRGSEFTELGDHRRMKTDITISNNGRIDGVTRIWTAKQWQGFTGAAAVVLTDADGNILYVTEPHSYGVDCKRCPGPSDRTQGWTDAVPSNVLSQVRKYAIIHTTNPRNRWREWLRDTKEAVQLVRGVIKEFN